MPANLDVYSSEGDCCVVTPTAGSEADPSVWSPVQVQSGADSSSSITKDRVLFRDVEDFQRKRRAFAAGGPDRLQIISGTGEQRYSSTIKH